MDRYVESYDSWSAFVERAEREHRWGHSRYGESASSWDFNTPFDKAVKLAKEGWDEGEAVARDLSLELFDRISSMIEREEYLYDVEGSEIDVARYLDGEPECWQRTETRLSEGAGRRIVKIVFNGFASCGVEARVLLAKGAAVTALIELLEFAGHGVELVLAIPVSNRMINRARAETRVHLKSADQPVDLPRLAFALAHPATFRRFGFSIIEQYPTEIGKAVGAYQFYGSPDDSDDCGDIYISKSAYPDYQWTSPGKARSWIIEQLKKQGVSLREQ